MLRERWNLISKSERSRRNSSWDKHKILNSYNHSISENSRIKIKERNLRNRHLIVESTIGSM